MTRFSVHDEQAVACARIAAAYDGLFQASLSRLLLHFAVRIASAALCAKGDTQAAVAALRREQHAALATLRQAIAIARRKAQRAACDAIWRRQVAPRRPCMPNMPVSAPRSVPVRSRRGIRSVSPRRHGPDP